MSSKRRRRRLSKKEYEQLERKEAQRELDARSESEDRQERIKVLWDAITSGELAQDAKDLADNELVRSLTELAQKQNGGSSLRLLRIELDSTSPPLPLSRMGIS
jgi:anti-sigma28 factor (negative regulator of flagellin synthesis)